MDNNSVGTTYLGYSKNKNRLLLVQLRHAFNFLKNGNYCILISNYPRCNILYVYKL